MRNEITADWARKRSSDDDKINLVRLKKVLKKIKSSANKKQTSCKIKFELNSNIITSLENLGFKVEFVKSVNINVGVAFYRPAYNLITW